MHTALYSILIDYGLSEIESTIYLTLLETGRGTIETIYGITKIEIHLITETLEEMYEHEYIFRIKKDGVFNYIANSPEELIQKRLESCKRLEEFLNTSETYDYEEDRKKITTLYIEQNANEIQYYEGVAGLMRYFDQHISGKKHVYAFIAPDEIHPILLEYLHKEHVPKRVDNNIPVLAITDSKNNYHKDRYLSLDSESARESLKIDNPLFNIGAGIDIFGDESVGFIMYNHHEMSAIIVKSKELYTTLKSMFIFIRNTYYTQK